MRDRRIGTFLLIFALILWLVGFRIGFADETPGPAIGVQEAARIVKAQFPNAHIREIELKTEDGRPVYEVELVTADRQKKELRVNAQTGKIEKIEQGD